jgi:hypothetical protein
VNSALAEQDDKFGEFSRKLEQHSTIDKQLQSQLDNFYSDM